MKKRISILVVVSTLLAGLACRGVTGGPAPDDLEPTARVATAIPATAAQVSDTLTGEDPANPAATTAPTGEGEPASPITDTVPDLTALSLSFETVAAGLESPIGIANAGDGSGRLFIIEKPGRIRVLADGVLLDTAFLDITDRVDSDSYERGLLGLAFHPEYASNGWFFVNYTDRSGNTVVARYEVTSDPGIADPGSERPLLNVNQPAANHNGGHITFGPGGYLYIGLGDGGAAGDIFGNGQNTNTFLATIMRIDVDELPYSIPADNPYMGTDAVLDEIWAYGVRNPWRFSFDRLTGDLYMGDVGQNIYEEINIQPASSPGGENYGWPIMEGFNCYDADTCDQSGLTMPVAEYNHSQGCSVTGGYVYRGAGYPALYGVYLFGDFCTGVMWGLAPDGMGGWNLRELTTVGMQISTFGEGEDGTLYIADMAGGTVSVISAQ